MATSNLIPLHAPKKGTTKTTIYRTISYVKNPEKTEGGTLVTAYGCNPGLAEAEFLYMKQEYKKTTGRQRGKDDVIAYHLRQSFRPGEITPEEANRLGQELAKRFTKGKNAYIVATHTDKRHIHTHIIISAVTLDHQRKFRNFWGSSKALRRLNDFICVENGYSIVEHPQRKGKHYKEWLGDQKTPTQRDGLRAAIEAALAQHPKDMDALLAFLQSAGWEVKRGKHIALRGPGQSRFKRLDSLGEGFTQDDLAAKLFADRGRVRKPNRRKTQHQPQAVNLIVDIQSRMRQEKGLGYERWARKYNLKEMARTLTFLREHDLLDMEKLEKHTEAASEKANAAFRQIQQIETRMKEISQLKTHIIQDSKTREVYAQYKKSNWSPKFAAAHEQEIALHKAAKKAFDALGVKKLPKVSDLNAEYAKLQREKDALCPDYKKARTEMRELLTARENVRRYLETDGQPTSRIEQNRKKIQS